MNNQDAINTKKNEDFWDVLILRREGQWVGFRAPWRSLKRSASYLSFLFFLSAVSLSGWLLARWQVHSLSRELSELRLREDALQLDLDKRQKEGLGELTSAATLSYLPSLESEEINTGSLDLPTFQVEFLAKSSELKVHFEVRRTLPVNIKEKFYWVAMLHGPPGILSFPPALASRKGEVLQYNRGQVIEDLSQKRSIDATFQVPTPFVQTAGPEPLYVSVLIYDSKGTLTHRKRQEITQR